MRKINLLILGILLISLLAGCNGAKVQNSPTAESGAGAGQTIETTGSQTIETESAAEGPAESEAAGSESVAEEPAESEAVESGAAEKEEVEFKSLDSFFGFADESGKKIISIPNETGNKINNPEEYNVAIGNNGEVVEIEFVKWQDANDKDTLRQTIYNFDNMAGYIYKAKSGTFIQNKSYLLSKKTVIPKNALVQLKSTKADASAMKSYKDVDAETVKKIEALKGRKIIESSLISETAAGDKICLVVFERKADDMLASIAYVSGDKVVFKDYPAKYDEMSTWRVDAGDRPGLFEVMFLAKSDEGLLLGLSWAAPEGENVFILKEVNGVFEETPIKSGRYTSPL